MFESPKRQSYDLHFKPGKYLARLKRLEDGGTGQYGQRIKWVWLLFNTGKNADGQDDPKVIVPIYGADGEPYEYFARTSTKFGKNPKTKKVAAARLYSEALLGRAIDDDEDIEALEQEIIGKPAILHIVANQVDDNTYFNIEYIEKYVKGTLVPPTPSDDEFPEADDEREPVAAGASSSEEMPW